jgi:hypothetical protein
MGVCVCAVTGVVGVQANLCCMVFERARQARVVVVVRDGWRRGTEGIDVSFFSGSTGCSKVV